MLRETKKLLELLTDANPPPSPARHSVTLHEDGLHLTVALSPQLFQTFIIDEGDLNRSAEAVFRDIEGLLPGEFRHPLYNSLCVCSGLRLEYVQRENAPPVPTAHVKKSALCPVHDHGAALEREKGG